MSIATEQSYEAKIAAIDLWERDHKPKLLAETAYNRDLIADFLAKKYGGYISVVTLNDAITSLKNKLQWLAAPAPEKPKGDLWNRMINLGLRVPANHGYESGIDRERIAAKRQQNIDFVAIMDERQKLLAERVEAQTVVVRHPKLQLISWGKTHELRKVKIEQWKSKAEAFNRKAPDDLKISI